MTIKAPPMLTPELRELRDFIVSLITQKPNISLLAIESECKKRLGLKSLNLNANFITAIAENRNIKWSPK